MRLLFVLLASFLFLTTAMSPEEFPIKKWVILMMENRSFDHLLGHLKKTNPEVDGLTGKESNPVNPFDPNSPKVYVNFDAPPIDPNGDHSVPGTTEEIFGGANMTHLNPPPMNGFYACAEKIQKGWGQDVLSTFNSKTLPVLSTLANEFLVMDKWFSSIPGPTEVNRAYLMSASSYGTADNDFWTLAEGFPQDCFQPLLSEAGYDWKVFFEYFPTSLFMRQLREWPTHFHSYWDFETLCESGELPTYTFLEPRYYSITSELPANDQHPDHNIQDGEELIKWIYEKLRAGPAWNETAFIIIYDEHGGMYDHVPTPLNIPNPDGRVSTKPPFDFKRIGVRVPAVIVSPWVNKGTVEHQPKGPFPDSQYEHSSVISTISKVLGINKHLTKRDEWAGTFEHVFLNRTTPRTDCPNTLPNPPKTRNRKNMMEQPLNELQTNIIAVAAHMNGLKPDEVLKTVKNEKQGGEFVAEMMNKYLVRTKGQKGKH